MPPRRWWDVVFLLTALLVVVADQLTKAWIRANLSLGEVLFEYGIFRITRVNNTGAAFGLFPDASLALTIIALVGVVMLLAYAFFISHRFPVWGGRLNKVSLGLVLGGTLGNLTDRLLQGSVTDFIDIGFWPAFNVADSAITVGTILLAYSFLVLQRKVEG